jgi:HemY protein
MKGLLWFLVLAALAVALSLALRGHGGYALFVLHPWRAEISLNLLGVFLIFAFAAGYFLLRVGWHALRLPSHVRAFRERRRGEKGRAAELGAIQALFEGQFVRAEKLASGAGKLGTAPGLASLLAARAAQRLRQFGRRDQWLERAKEGDGEWRLARLMTAAELLLDERRFVEARTVLRELNAGRPRHVAALLLSLRAEQGMANWEEVLRVANLLEKRDAMPPEVLDSVRVDARIAILSRKIVDRESLARHWEDTPRSERVRPRIAAAAARAFIELGDCRKAHLIIEEALERDWDGALALLYGECTDEDAFERLERAERWLRERPGEAELLLTLGRLCVQRELWGKAQSYLEASLATQPTQAAHVALARLFESIGRTEEANRHFRASADLGSAPRALD